MLRHRNLLLSFLVVGIAFAIPTTQTIFTSDQTVTGELDFVATDFDVRLLRHPNLAGSNHLRQGSQVCIDTLPEAARDSLTGKIGDTSLVVGDAALLEIKNTSGRSISLYNCSSIRQVGAPKCFAVNKQLFDPNDVSLAIGGGDTLGCPSTVPSDFQVLTTPINRGRGVTVIPPGAVSTLFISPTSNFDLNAPGSYRFRVVIGWADAENGLIHEKQSNSITLAVHEKDVERSRLIQLGQGAHR